MKKFLGFILLPVIAFSFFFFLNYQSSIEGFEGGSKVPLSIEYGSAVKDIVATLKEKEIIKKEWPMLIYLKWYKLADNLQAGDFIITRGTPIPDLVKILSNAKPQEVPVRIIEGSTIEEIDEILTSKGLIEAGEFLACTKECEFPNYNFFYDGNMEGYLFPDTYFVGVQNFQVKSFIQRLLSNFERRFLSDENKSLYKSQERTLSDIVIMASIIEKEERNTVNMPMISGILWKRLDQRIPIGADATTRYYEKNKSGFLRTEDFQKDNPYNTRRKLGLPPTAIGSPGLKALEAALNPKDSKYYYYLHDSQGNIHYAVTNDEHNINKRKYIR